MLSCGDKNLVIAAVHPAHRSERRGYACGAAAGVHGKSSEGGLCMCRVDNALRPMQLWREQAEWPVRTRCADAACADLPQQHRATTRDLSRQAHVDSRAGPVRRVCT